MDQNELDKLLANEEDVVPPSNEGGMHVISQAQPITIKSNVDSQVPTIPDYIGLESVFKGLVAELTGNDKAPGEANYGEGSLHSLLVSKEKASNFIAGLEAVISGGHLLEIINNSQKNIKREAELEVLNNLVDSYKNASESTKKAMGLITNSINKLPDSDDVDNPEDLLKLTTLLQTQASILEMTREITAGINKVIQTERLSGNRPWGTIAHNKSNITIIENLIKDNKKTIRDNKNVVPINSIEELTTKK
jgi:hypothetical protein